MIYHQVCFAMKPDAPKDQIGVRAMAPDGKLLEAVGVPIPRADPGWVQIARLRQVLGVLQLV